MKKLLTLLLPSLILLTACDQADSDTDGFDGSERVFDAEELDLEAYDNAEEAPEAAAQLDDEAIECTGSNGQEFNSGDVWQEDCNFCACTDAGTQCTKMDCGEPDSLDIPAFCDGYKLGEQWLDDDGCNMCSCTPMGVACTAMACDQEVE